MKVVILAAGYATRLEPITHGKVGKTLLPICANGERKPILYYILDKLFYYNERFGKEIEEIYVLSNEKYLNRINNSCKEYLKTAEQEIEIKVVSDGTTCKQEALGANGDLKFINDRMRRSGEDNDVLIIAGDNYFDFDIADLVHDYYLARAEAGGEITMVVSKDFPTEEMEYVQNGFAILDVNEDGRVLNMIEKPAKDGIQLDSTKGAIAVYLMDRKHLDLIDEYMEKYKYNPKLRDSIGYFISYLASKTPTYNFSFSSRFVDIGTPAEYESMQKEDCNFGY